MEGRTYIDLEEMMEIQNRPCFNGCYSATSQYLKNARLE
jgi:hypothetical protein